MAETLKESISDSSQSAKQERPKLPPVDFSAFIAELGTTAFRTSRQSKQSPLDACLYHNEPDPFRWLCDVYYRDRGYPRTRS